MGDYEDSIIVTADPDALFDHLREVGNLPDYLPAMTSAAPAGDGAVHTVAEVGGTRREGEAWFTADARTRSLRWGSEGPDDYRGELAVTGVDGAAEITVRLHTERVDGRGVRDALTGTLAQIKRNVEDGAETAPPSPS